MAAISWMTKGPYAGRPIMLSTADAAAAAANGWGSATPLEWKATDTAAIAARDATVDTGALGNWAEKVSDPKYSTGVDDAGTYVSPAEGAFTNITLTPATVDDAAGANTVVGVLAAVGGNTPVTFSIPGGSAIWNVSGTNLRKTSATAGLYTVGPMTVAVRATGEDGESFTKTLTITVT